MNLVRKIRQLSADRRSRRSAASATSRGGSEDVCTSGGGGPGSCASWADVSCVVSNTAASPPREAPPADNRNAPAEPLPGGGCSSARESRRSFELPPLRASPGRNGAITPPPVAGRICLSSSYDSSHRPPLPVPPASSAAHQLHSTADGVAPVSRLGRRNAPIGGEEEARNAGEVGEAAAESGHALKGKGKGKGKGTAEGMVARGKAEPRSEDAVGDGRSCDEGELSSCEEIASDDGGLTPPPHFAGQQEHSRTFHLYAGSNGSAGGGSGAGNAAAGASGAHGAGLAGQNNARGDGAGSGSGTNSLSAWRWHQSNKVAEWLLALPADLAPPCDSDFSSLLDPPHAHAAANGAAADAPKRDHGTGGKGGEGAGQVLGEGAQGAAGVGAESEVVITSAALGAAAEACAERQGGLSPVKVVAGGTSGGVQSCTASGTPSPSQPSPRAVVGGGGGADEKGGEGKGQEEQEQAEVAEELVEGTQGAVGGDQQQQQQQQHIPLPKRPPRQPDDVEGMVADLAPLCSTGDGGAGESAAEAAERQVGAARALRQLARGGEETRDSIVAAGAVPALVLILQHAADAAAATAAGATGAASVGASVSNSGRKDPAGGGASSSVAVLANPLVDYSISALVNLSVCRGIKAIINDAGAVQPLIVLLRGSAVPITSTSPSPSPLIGDSDPRSDAHSRSYTHGHGHSQSHSSRHSHSHSHSHSHTHTHLPTHSHGHQASAPAPSLSSPAALPPAATSPSTRANAAVALYSLSKLDDAMRAHMGDLGGVEALVGFLADGSVSKGRKDAVTALHSLSTVAPNRPRLVRAGAVPMLLDWVAASKKPAGAGAAAAAGADGACIAAGGSVVGSQRGISEEDDLVMVERALAVLAQVAACEEGRAEMAGRGGIETLLVLVQNGGGPSVACAEYAVAALLALANSSSTLRRKLHSLNLGPALTQLAASFSPKAKGKVKKLLDILHVH
ncbi:hypothetical protein CLOP_g12680 [Closterium sp. NIES-67]|nr:hypothetical protein CLOP_g12680 [Closterium sp. NIES-67]